MSDAGTDNKGKAAGGYRVLARKYRPADFSALIGQTGDLLTKIEANNALIEAEGVEVRSWVGTGTEHTVLGLDSFYDDEVDGTALRDWVAAVVAGEDVEDVRCTVCR